jgi:aconitate decarboxylase
MKEHSKITKIEAEMARAAYKLGGWKLTRPAGPTGAQMSVSYAVALQLLEGAILPLHFASKTLDRDDMWEVIDKVECREAEEFHHSWAQRVTVTFDDGEVLTVKVDAPCGIDPCLSNEDILQKWRTATKDVISEERQQAIEQAVLGLEELHDVVGTLRDLLAQDTLNVLEDDTDSAQG